MSDPQSGIKSYAVKITGFAFTEFNNTIYFNPYLLSAADQTIEQFIANTGLDWAKIQQDKGLTRIQHVIQFLIGSFIGAGFPDNSRKTDPISPLTPNVHFFMPKGVNKLLGLPQLEAAKDSYNYIFGIQEYAAKAQNLSLGMNPSNIPKDPKKATEDSRFIILKDPVEGNTATKPEYWNQIKAWSILNQFTNAPLNEMYTCFRIAPNGKILPTVVLRQIPFTTENFDNGGHKVTRFMNIPRWNISSALALSFDLGKDESLRKNFVQYYGRAANGPGGALDINEETAGHNYVSDTDDIRRNGLIPHVVTSEFDRIPDSSSSGPDPLGSMGFRSPGWARILGDALIGGHLKMSGTINFVGIPEPIAVGDNLQFDGVVYHIEQISHNASVQQMGKKTFRTTITVSNGVALESVNSVAYSEMTLGSAYDKRANDYNNEKILPGVSESQDVVYRKDNPDSPPSKNESFTQPNVGTSINKSTRNS